MPLPLAPVAAVALRYGIVAVAAYAISRKIARSSTLQANEDALDSVTEGLAAHHAKDRGQVNAQARWRRVIRKRSPRPIDVFSLGRLTLFGVVRLRARQGVLGELISEGVATA